MRTLLITLLPTLALAACTTAPEAPTALAAASAASAGAREGDSERLTGSRLSRQTNDRTVRSIGAEPARADMSEVRSIGNAVGARGN